jgi:hypothetical protein
VLEIEKSEPDKNGGITVPLRQEFDRIPTVINNDDNNR